MVTHASAQHPSLLRNFKYMVKLQTVGSEQKPLLEQIFQLYLKEYAEFTGQKPVNGVYEYPWLDDYFVEPERFPFFILNNDQLAGLALVRLREDDIWEMSEFFVSPEHRRRDVGAEACKLLFQKSAGTWEIGEDQRNTKAIQFWRNIIEQYASSFEETAFTNPGDVPRIKQVFEVDLI